MSLRQHLKREDIPVIKVKETEDPCTLKGIILIFDLKPLRVYPCVSKIGYRTSSRPSSRRTRLEVLLRVSTEFYASTLLGGRANTFLRRNKDLKLKM